jgi:hypothetical protein
MTSSFESSIPRSPIYRWCILFETFPIALISATHPNRWTIVISPHDFMIRYVPDVSSPRSAKRRTLMRQLTLLISSMCLQKMDGSDRLWGFHHKETRSLVLRIHDLSNPDMSMALSFSGLFPSPRIYSTHPLKVDGPDSTSGYRDLRCSVDTISLST